MTRPLLTVFLIDGSGSMRPAWDKAWSLLFDMVKEQPGAFTVIVFKKTLNMTDLSNIGTVEGAIIKPEGKGLYLIDYGKVIAEKSGNKLKRIPPPIVTFSGWTPLNDAIVETIKLMESRYNRTKVPYKIVVVSDNRDSRSVATETDVVNVKRTAKGLKKLDIVPVGEFLNKYLAPYDEIVAV